MSSFFFLKMKINPMGIFLCLFKVGARPGSAALAILDAVPRPGLAVLPWPPRPCSGHHFHSQRLSNLLRQHGGGGCNRALLPEGPGGLLFLLWSTE